MAEWLPYNTNSTIYFVLIGSGTAAFSTAGSGSLTGTNVQISKDGGAFATSTNTATSLGSGLYRLAMTTSELSAKQVQVLIAIGTLGTVVEHQAVNIVTYGNASAMYAFDLGAAIASANVTQWLGTGVPGSAGTPQVNLIANQATATVGTVLVVATGTITTITGTPVVDVVALKGTAIAGTQGTPIVNLVANQSTATVGTVVFLSSGTITTALNTLLANVSQVSGTNVTATGGRMEVDISHWKGTAAAGTTGTPLVNLVANQSTATVGTVTFLASGTITTALNTLLANVTQVSGTNVVATAGRMNVGSVDFVATGTVSTVINVVSANIVQVLGTAVTGTNGTLEVKAGALTGTIDANVVNWKGTAVPGTTGTPLVNLVADQTTATVGTVSYVATGTITYAGTVGTVTGTVGVNILSINGTALAASLLAQSVGAIGSGSATGTRTTTAFEVSGLTSTASDQYKGRIVLFISGTMQFQASDVTASRGSAAGTLAQLTITTLNATPADGVTFLLV